MPTPAEQKALVFVGIVILVAGAVRAVRSGAATPLTASAAEQQALARHASAANSSAVSQRQKQPSRASRPQSTAPRRRYVGAKFDSTGLLVEGTGVVSTSGFPPPLPRIDVDSRGSSLGGQVPAEAPARPALEARAALVDLDVAGTTEIERLPGIGPALAQRIVASRDSLGAFGGLPGLGRVKGVGPATLKRLARLVTFSGQARR